MSDITYGEWIPKPTGFVCSVCYNAFMFFPEKPPCECPVCGARMNREAKMFYKGSYDAMDGGQINKT